MRQHTVGPRAFTLIELLVVVAIIGLLLAILLPAMQEAREQGRTANCLSNLRQIGLGAGSYLSEFDDLPFGLPAPYKGEIFYLITEFIWGGELPDRTPADWSTGLADLVGYSAGALAQIDVYRVRAKDRPLNRYLSQEVSWDRPLAERLERRAESPGFFQCPSDRTAQVPFVGGRNPPPEDETIWRMWEYWGSSYPINWYWPHYYTEASVLSPEPFFAEAIGAVQGRPGLGNRIIRDKSGAAASEFLLFAEGQMSYALSGARPPGHAGGPWHPQDSPKQLAGWHKKRNRHVAGFMDGSARYDRYDTRFVFGSNWTIWPDKPWKGVWGQYDDFPPADDYAYQPGPDNDPNS